MEEMYGVIMIIAIIILTIILWRLYHKIVHKVYFGNMMQAVLGEILACLVVSVFIISAVQVFLGWVLGGVLSFVGAIIKLVWTVIKIAAIVGGIGGVIFIIYKAISAKGKNASNTSTGDKDKKADMSTDTEEKNNTNESFICPECGTSNDSESIFCESCGSKLQKDQQENKQENIEDKVEEDVIQEDVIQEVRCSQCGSLLSNEDKFCSVCGTALKEE